MQQVCEICGAVLHSPATKVEIDGAVMLACSRCAKLGTPVGGPIERKAQGQTQSWGRPRAPETEFELDPDYHTLIREAREKLGISQEELGRLMNEKPSVISHLETRRLKPDSILTKKLMHQLKINLVVSVSELEKRGP